MKFVERLDYLLKERNITRAQFLREAQLGKNQITYWEKNDTIPNPTTLKVISAYFGCTVEYLLGKSDDRTAEVCQNENNILSPQEQTLIEMFRGTTETGRMKIIQAVMNICDEIEKKPASKDTGLVG